MGMGNIILECYYCVHLREKQAAWDCQCIIFGVFFWFLFNAFLIHLAIFEVLFFISLCS